MGVKKTANRKTSSASLRSIIIDLVSGVFLEACLDIFKVSFSLLILGVNLFDLSLGAELEVKHHEGFTLSYCSIGGKQQTHCYMSNEGTWRQCMSIEYTGIQQAFDHFRLKCTLSS